MKNAIQKYPRLNFQVLWTPRNYQNKSGNNIAGHPVILGLAVHVIKSYHALNIHQLLVFEVNTLSIYFGLGLYFCLELKKLALNLNVNSCQCVHTSIQQGRSIPSLFQPEKTKIDVKRRSKVLIKTKFLRGAQPDTIQRIKNMKKVTTLIVNNSHYQGWKIFWVQKKFSVQKFFGQTKFLGNDILCPKQFSVQIICVQKYFVSKKKFCQKNFVARNFLT